MVLRVLHYTTLYYSLGFSLREDPDKEHVCKLAVSG